MLSALKKIINKLCRPSINKRLQQRLKNHEMSVISSNCNGALILHDLNQAFRSPFVNLYLEPSDFIRYLKNMQEYNAQTLTFIPSGILPYISCTIIQKKRQKPNGNHGLNELI